MKKLVIGAAVVMGVGVSGWEWWQWRHEETKNYGHGPGFLYTDAEEMDGKVDYPGFGLRIRYPLGWKIDQDARFLRLDKVLQKRPNGGWREVLGKNLLTKSLTVGTDSQKYSRPVSLVVELGVTDMSATDYVAREVERIKKEKLMFEGDREYRSGGVWQWTVLTYGTGEAMRKRAYAVSGERVLVVTAEYTRGSEFQFLRTFEGFLDEIKFIAV